MNDGLLVDELLDCRHCRFDMAVATNREAGVAGKRSRDGKSIGKADLDWRREGWGYTGIAALEMSVYTYNSLKFKVF